MVDLRFYPVDLGWYTNTNITLPMTTNYHNKINKLLFYDGTTIQ